MKPRMHLPPNTRRVSRRHVSIAILLLALPTESYAANKFWDNTLGGTFSTSSNWRSCGFFCNRVPDSSDIANFGISDPSSLFQFVYTVNFSANATNQALVVQDDLVTFDLNGHIYTTTENNQIGTQPGRSGELTITDGTWNFATNATRLVDIGAGANASGVLTVSTGGQISGSSAILRPNIDVGEGGAGFLTVSNGGDILANITTVGFESSGTATVTGAGSTLMNVHGVNVGHLVSGTMTISAGGLVQNTDGSIGNSSGITGTVSVADFNSRWINTGLLWIADGAGSIGQLSITNGGRVDDTDAVIGNGNGSTGTVTVGDQIPGIFGSQWINSATLTVGGGGIISQNAGNGTLNIRTNGHVQNTDAFVARTPGSIGQVNLNSPAAQWLNTGNLTIAQRGKGNVHITAGAIQNVNGTIGDESSSTGTVIVEGADSIWFNTGQLYVGDAGMGTLLIESGGSVSSTIASYLAFQPGSTGTAVVRGAGSRWNPSYLAVGWAGSGSLTIEDGGRISFGESAIGLATGSTGTVLVTGAGSGWNNNGDIYIGDGGNGSLSIEAGATASDHDGIIGDVQGVTGAVIVKGPGSSWTNSNLTEVGFSGTATLSIEAGGHVSGNNGTIGSFTGGNGTATVAGADSTWTMTGRLEIGGSFNMPGGIGTLNINPGGTVSAAQSTTIFSDGHLHLAGGTLDTASVSFQGGGAFNWTSGTLHVGTYNGNLTNQGGTLAPGHSAGSTTIVGNYTQQTGSTMEIEIGGPGQGTQYDFVNVTGNALIDGKLKLLIISGFTPTPSQVFVIFDSNSLLGVFENAGNGQRLATTDGGASFLVHYGVGSTFDSSQVVLTDFLAVALTGDYNQNGTVDAADYVVWRKNNGTTHTLPNDPFGGTIGQAQYNNWRAHFGQTAGRGAGITGSPSAASRAPTTDSAVPEPASLFLTIIVLSGLAIQLEQRRRR
jgi:T5SS/PEP-CTERM-associated repeat protein